MIGSLEADVNTRYKQHLRFQLQIHIKMELQILYNTTQSCILCFLIFIKSVVMLEVYSVAVHSQSIYVNRILEMVSREGTA